jgi:hypothetical protein
MRARPVIKRCPAVYTNTQWLDEMLEHRHALLHSQKVLPWSPILCTHYLPTFTTSSFTVACHTHTRRTKSTCMPAFIHMLSPQHAIHTRSLLRRWHVVWQPQACSRHQGLAHRGASQLHIALQEEGRGARAGAGAGGNNPSSFADSLSRFLLLSRSAVSAPQ